MESKKIYLILTLLGTGSLFASESPELNILPDTVGCSGLDILANAASGSPVGVVVAGPTKKIIAPKPRRVVRFVMSEKQIPKPAKSSRIPKRRRRSDAGSSAKRTAIKEKVGPPRAAVVRVASVAKVEHDTRPFKEIVKEASDRLGGAPCLVRDVYDFYPRNTTFEITSAAACAGAGEGSVAGEKDNNGFMPSSPFYGCTLDELGEAVNLLDPLNANRFRLQQKVGGKVDRVTGGLRVYEDPSMGGGYADNRRYKKGLGSYSSSLIKMNGGLGVVSRKGVRLGSVEPHVSMNCHTMGNLSKIKAYKINDDISDELRAALVRTVATVKSAR